MACFIDQKELIDKKQKEITCTEREFITMGF